MGNSRQYLRDPRPTAIATAVLLALTAAGPAVAIEQVLDAGRSSLIGTVGTSDTSFGFPNVAVAALRLVTAAFALFMAATAFHGWVLGKHHDGSVNRKKAADGAFQHGIRGFAVSIALAAVMKPLVTTVFTFARLN